MCDDNVVEWRMALADARESDFQDHCFDGRTGEECTGTGGLCLKVRAFGMVKTEVLLRNPSSQG